MERSTVINELAAALAKAQGAFPIIKKTGEVDFTHGGRRTNYSYADLAVFTKEIKKPLADNGLSVLHDCKTGADGCSASTILLHSSGQWMQSEPITIRSSDNKPQGLGAALTFARRYSLTSFLALSAEDEDLDAAQSASIEPKVPVKFGESPEHMESAMAFFNMYDVHKDDRKKLMGWLIEKNHSPDPVLLAKTIEAAAKKIAEGKDES